MTPYEAEVDTVFQQLLVDAQARGCSVVRANLYPGGRCPGDPDPAPNYGLRLSLQAGDVACRLEIFLTLKEREVRIALGDGDRLRERSTLIDQVLTTWPAHVSAMLAEGVHKAQKRADGLVMLHRMVLGVVGGEE